MKQWFSTYRQIAFPIYSKPSEGDNNQGEQENFHKSDGRTTLYHQGMLDLLS
jgi:hypothetical protein